MCTENPYSFYIIITILGYYMNTAKAENLKAADINFILLLFFKRPPL